MTSSDPQTDPDAAAQARVRKLALQRSDTLDDRAAALERKATRLTREAAELRQQARDADMRAANPARAALLAHGTAGRIEGPPRPADPKLPPHAGDALDEAGAELLRQLDVAEGKWLAASGPVLSDTPEKIRAGFAGRRAQVLSTIASLRRLLWAERVEVAARVMVGMSGEPSPRAVARWHKLHGRLVAAASFLRFDHGKAAALLWLAAAAALGRSFADRASPAAPAMRRFADPISPAAVLDILLNGETLTSPAAYHRAGAVLRQASPGVQVALARLQERLRRDPSGALQHLGLAAQAVATALDEGRTQVGEPRGDLVTIDLELRPDGAIDLRIRVRVAAHDPDLERELVSALGWARP